MPFAVLGGIIIFSLLMSQSFLLESRNIQSSVETNVAGIQHGGMINLLTIPIILAEAYAIFVGYLVVYAVTALIFGSICDRMKEPTFLTLFGGLLVFIAFMTVGPASFIPIKPLLWLTLIGLPIFGLCLGAVFISTFLIFLKDARRHNYPESAATSCLVSALWNTTHALGSLTGPVASGILQDNFGFRNATYAVLVLSIGLIFVTTLLILKRRSFMEQNLCVSTEDSLLLKSEAHSE